LEGVREGQGLCGCCRDPRGLRGRAGGLAGEGRAVHRVIWGVTGMGGREGMGRQRGTGHRQLVQDGGVRPGGDCRRACRPVCEGGVAGHMSCGVVVMVLGRCWVGYPELVDG
jgi:hypothetical protein